MSKHVENCLQKHSLNVLKVSWFPRNMQENIKPASWFLPARPLCVLVPGNF